MTNTTQTVFTNLNFLKGIAEIAATKDIRYYLMGVYFECNQASTRLVATDGHCLGLFQTIQENQVGTGAINFIMPLDIIKMLKTSNKQHDEVTITLERADQTQPDLITGGTVQVYGGAVISWKAVDGRFPDYIRVLPKEPMTGESTQFDPSIVQKFVKAAKLICTRKDPVPMICQNGNQSALVDIGDNNFIGVIMPRRDTPSMTATPARFLTRLA
jgi:hypothetical protein